LELLDKLIKVKHFQKIFLLFVYTFLFSALIFVGKGIFLEISESEEIFLEQTLPSNQYLELETGEEFYSFS